MNETIPHTMINAITGDRTVIQLTPRPPLTVADVEKELAERKAEGTTIDPERCEIFKYYAEALDIYGLLEVPNEWSCVGSELFVRNLPNGYWVWLGDLPDELCDAVLKRMERGRAARKAVADPPF